MIGVRYVDELFAIYRIPRELWNLIKKDLRYDGKIRQIEGFAVFLAIPLLFSTSVFVSGIIFGSQFYSLLIGAATLFVGFSMNAVLLLLRYSNEEDPSEDLIDQTRNLISYLLYLGVVLAFLGLLGYSTTSEAVDTPLIVNQIATASSVLALSHFLIVVLFLPARIFTIIENST